MSRQHERLCEVLLSDAEFANKVTAIRLFSLTQGLRTDAPPGREEIRSLYLSNETGKHFVKLLALPPVTTEDATGAPDEQSPDD